jgi:peroxiredoxin
VKNLKILLPGIIFLALSFLWGYQNRAKFHRCYQLNQELLRELKEVSRDQKTEWPFLDEGDSLDHSLTLSLIGDRPVTLGTGESCLLIFFDTACPACLQAAVDLYAGFLQYEERGLNIVSVSRARQEDLASLAAQGNWPMVIAHDSTGQLHRLFRISGLPSVVFIDRGMIKMKANALSIDRRLPELEEMIAAAVPRPAGF